MYDNTAGEIPSWIGRRLRRWGRMQVTQTKWKYETIRVYCEFGWHQLHSITHPGHMYCRYPQWLWSLDCRYISRVLPRLTNWAVVPFQRWLYRRTYAAALRRCPEHAYALLMGADHTELLLGLDPRLRREWQSHDLVSGGYYLISWCDPAQEAESGEP